MEQSYKEKYEQAIERLKQWDREHPCAGYVLSDRDKFIFPELAESKDEKIRKRLITDFGTIGKKEWGGLEVKDILAWLEKQGDKCLVNFDEAEKEKYDFVSGQFIECRKSFNEFKEDNSYWLEYVGDDNYIGRSDNILNQKFHITPRQLYCLFSQQHCPKENNVNEETQHYKAYWNS